MKTDNGKTLSEDLKHYAELFSLSRLKYNM